jgi:hypothetical protein
MTEAPARRKRLSKGRVRAIAWVAGGATFLTGWGVLGMAPKPASSAGETPTRQRRPVVVHKILRRVIVIDPVPGAPVRSVPVPSAGGGTTGGGVSAPAPRPPTTTTGGS